VATWAIKEGGESEVRLAMEMWELIIADKNKQVANARHKFTRKRHARQYQRELPLGIESAIRKAIFGRIRCS